MRMRKKKNLIPRMERCGDRLIREPYSMPGKWRELMPQARELRRELSCLCSALSCPRSPGTSMRMARWAS